MREMSLRPDYRRTLRMTGEKRSPERLAAHYTIEKGLTQRLRNASRSERSQVYSQVYAELFASVPDHPQHTAERTDTSQRIAAQLAVLLPILAGRRRYLEVGCGDAAVAFAIARHVDQAYGLDVTDALIDASSAPANFRFLPTDGVRIPLADEEIDLAYSNQLMEHLHPDDAIDQLKEIARVLAPGGTYVCITPSRFTGPHDISAYFDYEARGFHLREYDYRSLRRLMLSAGFRSVRFFVGGGRLAPAPYFLISAVETVMDRLPPGFRALCARRMFGLFGVNAIAQR